MIASADIKEGHVREALEVMESGIRISSPHLPVDALEIALKLLRDES